MRERIGFIGLGIMGRPMATNLIGANHHLVVHSRSAPPIEALVALGASAAATPAEVAAEADIIITMLPDTPDLRDVVGGPNGLLEHARPGTLLVDMSTVDPLETRAIAGRFEARGIGYVDAPVSGGEKGAIDATLSIMVGGSEADVARAMPLFEVMGKTIVHVGDVGAGQFTKAANQLVDGVTIEAVAEALALAEAAGIDAWKVRQALLGGFAASRILEVHGERMLNRTFQPGFRSRLHLKDARIITDTAGKLGVRTPALEVALDGFRRLAESGRGDLDHSALFLLVQAAGDDEAAGRHDGG